MARIVHEGVEGAFRFERDPRLEGVIVNIHEGQRYRVRPDGKDVGPWADGPATIQIDGAAVLEIEECRPMVERGAGVAGALDQDQVCPEGHGPLGPRPRCLQCGRPPVWRRP